MPWAIVGHAFCSFFCRAKKGGAPAITMEVIRLEAGQPYVGRRVGSAYQQPFHDSVSTLDWSVVHTSNFYVVLCRPWMAGQSIGSWTARPKHFIFSLLRIACTPIMCLICLQLDFAHLFRRCQGESRWKGTLGARIGSTFKVRQLTQ